MSEAAPPPTAPAPAAVADPTTRYDVKFTIVVPPSHTAKAKTTVPLGLPWGGKIDVKVPKHAKPGEKLDVNVKSPPGWTPPPPKKQVRSIKRKVAIPKGAKPGDNLNIELPWGAMHLVKIPAGATAGQIIDVEVEIPGGQAQYEKLMASSKPAKEEVAKKSAASKAAESAAAATTSLAAASIRRVIEKDPTNYAALSDLGNLLGMAKDYDGAEKAYCRSIDANPRVAGTWVNLGSLLSAVRSDYEGAELAFRRAIELEPRHSSALQMLAELLANKKKDYAEAERIFLRYIEENKADTTWVRTLKQIRELKEKKGGFVEGYPPSDISYATEEAPGGAKAAAPEV